MPLYRATYLRPKSSKPSGITFHAACDRDALSAYENILSPPGVYTLTLQRIRGRYSERGNLYKVTPIAITEPAPSWSWERTLPQHADGTHGTHTANAANANQRENNT